MGSRSPRADREMDDAALVRAAQAGAVTAYGELVRIHQAELRHFLHRACRSPADADDLAQEAFLRAWQRLKDLNDPRLFRSWLYTTALRAMLDVKKSRRRARSRDETWAAGQIEMRGHDGDPNARIDLDAAIRALPERERVVASLMYVAGFSQSEVSSMTGIPLGSVKTLSQTARERLARHLSSWHRQGDTR